MKIRVKFVDFWHGFNTTDNFFTRLLSQKYEVEISDNPEILFFSCFGKEYLKYKCLRVFYTPENERPDFTACDYAISFDHINHKRHIRFPLYSIYLGHQYPGGGRMPDEQELTRIRSRAEIESAWKSKTKFCCIVVSNSLSKRRLDFFQRLSNVKRVDSGGRTMNNIGGPVADKLNFIQDYKFVISFENSSRPGYLTEKIIEPMAMDCIPVYWGDPLVKNEFSEGRFLHYNDFPDEDAIIKRMLEIDANDELAIDMLLNPVFKDNKLPKCAQQQELFNFIDHIITIKDNVNPKGASGFYRLIHNMNRRWRLLRTIILVKLNKKYI